MFLEPNPQPIKAALEMMGKCRATVRAPLVDCSPEVRQLVRAKLTEHNLL